MNELALFNDLFDGFGDDGFLMPSFNYKKVFAPKVDVKEEKDEYSMEMDLPYLFLFYFSTDFLLSEQLI